MGEPTYQQRLHMDIHGEAQPVKRRPLRGKAAESNELPELKAATKEAMPRHGVQVVMIDEAHHIPPLPPRETPPLLNGFPVPAPVAPETSNGSTPSGEVAPLPDAEQPKAKKTRSRKKVEATDAT